MRYYWAGMEYLETDNAGYLVEPIVVPSIKADCFQKLLDLCVQNSSCFSLTLGGWLYEVDTMQQELEPYVITEVSTHGWFGYHPKGEIKATHIPLKRLLYSANTEAMQIIMKYNNDLWFGGNERWPRQTLDDLCFFSNDKILLGTVSHEYICKAYPPDTAFETKLLELGSHWKKDNTQDKQICLSDYITL